MALGIVEKLRRFLSRRAALVVGRGVGGILVWMGEGGGVANKKRRRVGAVGPNARVKNVKHNKKSCLTCSSWKAPPECAHQQPRSTHVSAAPTSLDAQPPLTHSELQSVYRVSGVPRL